MIIILSSTAVVQEGQWPPPIIDYWRSDTYLTTVAIKSNIWNDTCIKNNLINNNDKLKMILTPVMTSHVQK